MPNKACPKAQSFWVFELFFHWFVNYARGRAFRREISKIHRVHRSLYILTSPFFFSVHKTFNSGGPFLFSLSQTLTYATCDCDKYLCSQITVIFLGLQKENVHLSCLWIKSSLPTPPPKKKLANNGSLSVLSRFSAKSNTCAFLRVK